MDKIRKTYQKLDGKIHSMFYEPVGESEKSKICILLVHPYGDYMTFSPGEEMAKRGYCVLCANVSNPDSLMEDKMSDVRIMMDHLKGERGFKAVLLWGHSGGASLLSAYQSVAENGVQIFRGSEKIVKCQELSGFQAAEGMLLPDSNWGNGAMALFSVDPAVYWKDGKIAINPELDIFNPENGFRENGAVYSDAFVHKFLKAQGKRNNELIERALERLHIIDQGEGQYSDDEPFIIPAASMFPLNNKLFPQDIRYFSHTKGSWPLLCGDGGIRKEIVHSVRRPYNMESLSRSYRMGAAVTTVRLFLNTLAVRVTDDYYYNEDTLYGVDWTSSFNCTPGNMMGVHVPTLVMGMTGGYEFSAAETIYENAAAEKKELVFVEGADHNYQPATECETYPGQFGNTEKRLFDYTDHWIEDNFC